MAKMKIVSCKERKFISSQERAKKDPRLAAALDRLPSGERDGYYFFHHEGSASEPQLFEVKLPPHRKVDPHAHDADEIIVVTEGEIHLGKQVYGAGSSVFVPKMTLYSFQAGPQGLTFLNFRPTKTSGAIFKDEFMAKRAGAKGQSS